MDNMVVRATRFAVSRTWCGRVNIRLYRLNEETVVSVEPMHAMSIWRCLTGEIEEANVKRIVPMLGYSKDLSVRYVDSITGWIIRDSSMEVMIDADQALAIAWAIKSVVTSIALESESSNIRRVFVLSARTFLTGDCAENGVDQIGGTEKVFESEEYARDNVREFMRPLVNESFGEAYWDERNVDDELDDILAAAEVMYKPLEPERWVCDGQKQAFVVELSERAVL